MQNRARPKCSQEKHFGEKESEMSNPMDDFVASFKTVYGEGFFEGNLTAVHYAQTMSKS